MSNRSTKGVSCRKSIGPVACRFCDLNEICRLSGLIALESGRHRHTGALRTVHAGASLFRAGEPVHSIYAIRKGMFKLVRTSAEGDENVLALHTPGEVLGLEAFSQTTYAADAIAVQSTICCEVPLQLLREQGSRVHEISSALIGLLSRAASPGADMTRGPIRQRIIAFLLDLALRLKNRDLASEWITLGLTRREIAQLLDTRIETVSRILQELNRERQIRVRGDSISLLTLAADKSAAIA